MCRCNWTLVKQKFSINVALLRGIVLCASIFGLVFYVDECYTKFKIKPEVLVNEKLVSSRTVPFPAVTICAPVIAKSEFLNLTKLNEEVKQNKVPNRSDLNKLLTLQHICPDHYHELSTMAINKSNGVNETAILDQLSPGIDDIFSACSFDKEQKCKNVFIRSLTDYGYCFSFNMLEYHSIFNDGVDKDFDCYKQKNILKSFDPKAPVEFQADENDPKPSNSLWTLEEGYSVDDNFVKPVRATRRRTLVVKLKTKISGLANSCMSRSYMFVMNLHLPNELPTVMHSEKFLRLSSASLLKITARVKQSDETLKNFRLEERGCYFEGEHNLKYFKSYTKLNCEYECLINFTYKHCGCVKLSMPRTENMKVCKYKDIECYLTISRFWPNIYFANVEQEKEFSDFPCGCMPSCTQIKYMITDKTIVSDRNPSDGFIHSTLSILFEDSQISMRTNYVTYKVQNFMSDIGGLIGLFLGFSLLSLFELLLRVFYYLRKLIKRWIGRLKQKLEELKDDNTLTEVIAVKEYRRTLRRSRESSQHESVSVISDTTLQIEDLE